MIVSFPEPGETKGTPMGNLEIEDYSVKRWPSGKIYVRYLYKDLLDRLAEDMKANINDSYDNFVVIDGPVGSGKSNLAYALCIRYDQGFDFRQYVYDANGFKSKLNDDISKKTFWIDEGPPWRITGIGIRRAINTWSCSWKRCGQKPPLT